LDFTVLRTSDESHSTLLTTGVLSDTDILSNQMDFSISDFMTRFDTSVFTSPELSLGVTDTLVII
jgi:hypothetical protein